MIQTESDNHRANWNRRQFLETGLAAAGMVFVGFVVSQPYAILDFKEYSRSILEQSHMVRYAGDYMAPYYPEAPK